LDLKSTEIELKKRWRYPYKWGRVQNDVWDKKSRFIYRTKTVEEVLSQANKVSSNNQSFVNYCLNRWYNFWSAQAVEHMFAQHPLVQPAADRKDKEKDFFIQGIPFDHKTTVLPKGYGHTLSFVNKRKTALCRWFYENQSQQGRHHLKNRLFVVLHQKEGNHWKLKAELSWLYLLVWDYLDAFNQKKLLELKLEDRLVKSDIIFGIR
jgi:hypothetical protein